MSTALVRRVARRYQAAVVLRDVPADRVEYTEGGTLSACALEKVLLPPFGFIMRLRFRPSLRVDPNGVDFEALTEAADVVAVWAFFRRASLMTAS